MSSSNVLRFSATHGTDVAAASSIIRQDRFNIASAGQIGRGEYFWDDSAGYGQLLAEDWFFQKREAGGFGPRSVSGVVIRVCLRCLDGEHLPLEDPSIRAALDAQYEELKRIGTLPRREVFYNIFVSRLETAGNRKYLIISSEFDPPAPRKGSRYPLRGVKPRGYCVRHDRCIRIVGKEDIKE